MLFAARVWKEKKGDTYMTRISLQTTHSLWDAIKQKSPGDRRATLAWIATKHGDEPGRFNFRTIAAKSIELPTAADLAEVKQHPEKYADALRNADAALGKFHAKYTSKGV